MSSEIKITISSRDKRRRAPIVSSAQPVCGICKKQFSRYTCPKCNLHYCSLPCFRDASHATCTEPFDRETLQDDIRGGQGRSQDEKRAMLDMLKRFEEQDLESNETQDEESDGGNDQTLDEGEELERKLAGRDLDSLSPAELLELLSPAQRDRFTQTILNQDKAAELVDAELGAETPWWDDKSDDDATLESARCLPNLVADDDLPLLKLDADGAVAVNPNLIYNVVALLMAYSYAVRSVAATSFQTLPTDVPERALAIDGISNLAPFLVERSSTVLSGVTEAIDYVHSRGVTAQSASPRLMVVLLRDVIALLSPTAVMPAPEASTSKLASHPSSSTFAALSDLHHLFGTSASLPSHSVETGAPERLNRQKKQSTRQKLLFYIAFLASIRSPVSIRELRTICARLESAAATHEQDLEGDEDRDVTGIAVNPAIAEQHGSALIQAID